MTCDAPHPTAPALPARRASCGCTLAADGLHRCPEAERLLAALETAAQEAREPFDRCLPLLERAAYRGHFPAGWRLWGRDRALPARPTEEPNTP